MSSTPPATPLPAHVRTLVVGSGFAGLGMAIALQKAGRHDFLVLERGPDVGGTWRDNTYPGAACDVPSQLYSFSFAPNPHWTRSFSFQPEIQAYLQRVSRQAGVLDRFRFETEVQDLAWDEGDRIWRVTTSAGAVTADVVVTGSGGLSEPKRPEIARHRRVLRRGLPLGPVEPRLRPDRQARRGDRHRGLLDPDRAEDR